MMIIKCSTYLVMDVYKLKCSRMVGDKLLVGCTGLSDPLRQYFSLYRVVSQREKEKRNDR